MHDEHGYGETASPVAEQGGAQSRPRFSRRQAIGRMSAVAGAGAAAWVVPEILTAKPAAGASLSGTSGNTGGGASAGAGVSTSASTGGTPGVSASGGATVSADSSDPASAKTLAYTGLDIRRDAEVGAALVAGGWAMHHWASRRPKPAAAADGMAALREAGSAGPAN